MADDIDARHERRVDLGYAPRTAAELVRRALGGISYLPAVAGGSTWIARVDGVPAVIVTRVPFSAELRFHTLATGGKQASVGDADEVVVFFDYYLDNAPDRLVVDLDRGVMPERRYAR